MTDQSEATQEQTAPESARPWHDKLKAYREQVEDKWKTQRDNLDKLYVKEQADSADRQYSIFWANIEVLKAAVYARAPVPVVAPRFKQANPIASAASEVLERTLVTTFEQGDVDGCLREVRDEFLRYARGSAWPRLGVSDEGTERVEFDHVTANDFAHDPARTWREVKWVARRAWVDREDGRKRFDEPLQAYGKKFDDVPCKKKDDQSAVNQKDDQAPVWEIWDKRTKTVYWVNEEFDCILDRSEPWLTLASFWPCPKPAFGTIVPGKLRPVPDIRQYKDQIEEINEYTARIASLSQQLRLKGFYPAGTGELGDAIEAALKSTDNRATLVPVSSWAAFGNTSPKDTVVWIPVEQVAAVITSLVDLRRVIIEDVYQITGISDIVRGQTDAGETATAQQIKSQWGSIRIRDRQNELSRFARDIERIAAEIIAENFQPETIKEMSQTSLPSAQDKMQAQAQMQMQQMQQQQGMPAQPPDPAMQKMLETPSFEEVIQFLRNDRARGFTIEIETDSTIQPDEDAEKQRRIEFVTAIGGLFQQALPVLQVAPQMAPFFGEILKFTAQGFRAGRPLEGEIDQMVETFNQMAQQPQQPQEDPKLAAEKAKAELAAKSEAAKHELETQKFQHQQQVDAAKIQNERETNQMKLGLEREKMALDDKRSRDQMTMDDSRDREKHSADVEARSKPATTVQFDANKAMSGLPEMIAQLVDSMGQQVAEATRAMQSTAQAMQGTSDAMHAAVKAISAPKRTTVVRGQDGKAAHSIQETIQ